MSEIDQPRASLHAVMAGSGSPYAYMTPHRRRIVRALHDSQDPAQIAAALATTEAAIEADLRCLVEAHLVHAREGRYAPAFFVADAAEVQRVLAHAGEMGPGTGCLRGRWLVRPGGRLPDHEGP